MYPNPPTLHSYSVLAGRFGPRSNKNGLFFYNLCKAPFVLPFQNVAKTVFLAQGKIAKAIPLNMMTQHFKTIAFWGPFQAQKSTVNAMHLQVT